MARLIDEGFEDVCLLAPMEFSFVVRKIRRRLTFLTGDSAPAREQANKVCAADGVTVSTVVSIGIALNDKVPDNKCDHLDRLIYTKPFFRLHNTTRLELVVWSTLYSIKSLVEIPRYPATLAGSGAHVVELRLARIEGSPNDN